MQLRSDSAFAGSMRICTVVGARPQFINVAALARTFASNGIEHFLGHTGQHYDFSMSQVFFEELALPQPDVNLGIGSRTAAQQIGQMMIELERVFAAQAPDWVVVVGDTNSTLAGTLAASKLGIRVAHVEAGVRSFNRQAPEEINRILTDHASELLLAPTKAAVTNLGSEGFDPARVALTGDVMYDVFLRFRALAESREGIYERSGVSRGHYVLATVHRSENTEDDNRLHNLFEGLRRVARHLPVLVPLHPRTRHKLAALRLDTETDGLRFLEPVSYLEMLTLEQGALVIATDSGGVQKEAFFCRVPCVTLLEETEWVELIEAGWNQLCAPGSADCVAEAVLGAVGRTGSEVSPYGEGEAAQRIAAALASGRRQDVISQAEKTGRIAITPAC